MDEILLDMIEIMLFTGWNRSSIDLRQMQILDTVENIDIAPTAYRFYVMVKNDVADPGSS